VALCDGDTLRLDDIQGPIGGATPQDARPPAPTATGDDIPLPTDLQGHLDQQERDILVKTLKETGFNRTLAATRLGLSLRQIRYRIARLKIDVPRDEGPDE
jgi:two-component system response regulator PilR (NtrC family)